MLYGCLCLEAQNTLLVPWEAGVNRGGGEILESEVGRSDVDVVNGSSVDGIEGKNSVIRGHDYEDLNESTVLPRRIPYVK